MVEHSTPGRERDVFFLVAFLAVTAVGIVSAFAIHAAYLVTDSAKPLGDAKVWVTVADLLTTLILASLITLPLTVAYLLGKERELKITIAKETVFHLERTGAALASFRAAYLFLADPRTPDDLTPLMRSLGEFAGVGDDALSDGGLSAAALIWLLPNKGQQRNYRCYFADGGDRRALAYTAVILGIAAGACFIDLYCRFLGVRSPIFDLVEQVVVVLTAGYNVLVYVMLFRIVQLKSGLKQQAIQELRKMCGEAREQIATALSKADALTNSMRDELRRDLSLQADDGADTGNAFPSLGGTARARPRS